MIGLKEVKAFVFDIDGVFTDGSVLALPNGDLLRIYNAKDGFAVRTAVVNGFPVGIITGGCSEGIVNRFKSLCIPAEDIYQLSKDKLPDLLHFCDRHNITPADVAFCGDDIPDIPVLRIVGLSVAPADATQEVRDVVDIISPYPGGKRCVRHLIESVLKSQDKWIFNPEQPWGFKFPDEIADHAKITGKNV